jgi:hypothetical protein
MRIKLDLFEILRCRLDNMFLFVNYFIHLRLHKFLDVGLATIINFILETHVDNFMSTINVIFLYQTILD